MINGFRLRFTTAELAKHLTDRATYHRLRADEKSSKLADLQAMMDALKEPGQDPANVAQMTKTRPKSGPVEDLEDEIREHRNKALVFALFSTHLFDEDYDLSEPDLIRLEILRR